MRLLYGLVKSRRENTCSRLGGLGGAPGDTGLASREGLPCLGSVPPAPYQMVSRSLESEFSSTTKALPSPAPLPCPQGPQQPCCINPFIPNSQKGTG